jgi:hypothetical protein
MEVEPLVDTVPDMAAAVDFAASVDVEAAVFAPQAASNAARIAAERITPIIFIVFFIVLSPFSFLTFAYKFEYTRLR